jgi:NlpC/P60 family putative phage cell wall peptidase
MSAAPDAVVAAARAWLGTPYRHQASTLGAGCDCLGLVRGVWRTLHGGEPWAVPPYGAGLGSATPALGEAAQRWLLPAEGFGPGRVILFRLRRTLPSAHCAILVGQGRFVHAQERIGVVEADLTEAWRRRIAGVFAFP